MNSNKFARAFIGLEIPLTEEDWFLLRNLLERVSPGITDNLLDPTEPESKE